MKKIIVGLMFLLSSLLTYAQVIQLKFTALYNGNHVNLDSVRITDLEQPGDTMLYWPDTVLVLGYVGISPIVSGKTGDFSLHLISANPVENQAIVDVFIPSEGMVALSIFDVAGRMLQRNSCNLKRGNHLFSYSPERQGVFIVSATWQSSVSSVKIIYSGRIRGNNELNYAGEGKDLTVKTPKILLPFAYDLGDSLRLTAWFNGMFSTILTAPQANTSYTFPFYLNSQCPGIQPFNYGSQVYHAIQIGTQCWIKENLNIGSMIPGSEEQLNNQIIEKYCIDNDTANCTIYGGLYQWDEMMQYISPPIVQGICPPGFHVPAFEEWETLINYLGGGAIAGGKMKETGLTHWLTPNTGATNLSGFTALGAGGQYPGNYFIYYKDLALFWSSSETIAASSPEFILNHDNTEIYATDMYKTNGRSVRCLKDTCSLPPNQSDAGPDQLNLLTYSTPLAANAPLAGEQASWTIISGIGGILTNPNGPVSTFTGYPGRTFKLVWTIINPCYAASRDTVTVSFSVVFGQPCPGLPTVIHGGQTYNTIQIGFLCWMKENLNIGNMIAGTSDQINNNTIEKYCYNDDPLNCDVYGGLYQWDEMMQYSGEPWAQGICPGGWHIPVGAEWQNLLVVLGDSSIAGGKLKETGFTHWNSPNAGATNESIFTGLGAGNRNSGGSFGNMLNFTGFWSTMGKGPDSAWLYRLQYDAAYLSHSEQNKKNGFSVRCIKDTCSSVTVALAGPDQILLTGNSDSVILSANVPQAWETGSWTITGGMGGSLVNVNDPSSVFFGLGGQVYKLIWTIRNECYTMSKDTVVIAFENITGQPCPFLPSFTYSGQTYSTVQIGLQCWMRENLNIGTMINGSGNQSDNAVIEKYCYNNDPANCAVYGGLYQWDEMMQYATDPGVRGICPEGWHLPTDAEWCSMTTFLDPSITCAGLSWIGTNAGGKLKEAGFSHWLSPNTGATNESGFTAYGSGRRSSTLGFIELNSSANFWTSSWNSGTFSFHRRLTRSQAAIWRYDEYLSYGMSVRCVKDTCFLLPGQSDAGQDQIDLQAYTTILTANDPPAGEQAYWSIASGSGGSFEDINSPVSAFTGYPGQIYKLVWTVINSCFLISTDTLTISFATVSGQPCPGLSTFNFGGQSYNTLLVGYQCWMKENLNFGTFIQGSENQTDNGFIEKYCYNNDTSLCAVFGGLYQWDEMMQYGTVPYCQGICPPGFHLPADHEWNTLINYLGGEQLAGGKLKETGLSHWNPPNTGASNVSAFTALGAGNRTEDGNFEDILNQAGFWSSALVNTDSSWYQSLSFNFLNISKKTKNRKTGLSVRCVKNCFSIGTASAGSDQIILSGDSAVLSANIPPALQTGTWTVAGGFGGVFENEHNPASVFFGQGGQVYMLIWTIRNTCGAESSDTVVITFANITGQPCPFVPSVTYSNHAYNTVQIGLQCWMRENLNIGTMIPDSANQSDNNIVEKYCYNNDYANCAVYGGLYQWNEMMQYSSVPGSKGICPDGWHIPSDAEWCTMATFLDPLVNCNALGYNSLIAGGKLKETGLTHWYPPNTGGSNESGLSSFGAGHREDNGGFAFIYRNSYLWSSSGSSASNHYHWVLYYNDTRVSRYGGNNTEGYSVRCLKDTCFGQPVTADAGPDQLYLQTFSTFLAANVPNTGQQAYWSITGGNGGSLADIYDPVSGFTGEPGQTYKLVWTILSSCFPTTRDTVVVSFDIVFGQPCPGLSALTIDNQTYNTIQVGNQCWLKENLNTGSMIPGSANQSDNSIIEKYCYNNDSANCAMYGGLYQWKEMMQYSTLPGSQGICPQGFHVPGNSEWSNLSSFLGGVLVAGGKLKETGFSHWTDPNTGATNESEFTALGAGFRYVDGNYFNLLNNNGFWSSSANGNDSARIYALRYNTGSFNNSVKNKGTGYSIRCIKDSCFIVSTAQAGLDQTIFTGSTAILAANTPPVWQTGTWTIAGGISGSFENVNDPASLFTGQGGQIYKLVWTIRNACNAISSDTVIISFENITVQFCPGIPTFTYAGQTYGTVQIGSQCWMKENLNIGTMVQGSENQVNNNIIEKYCYNNDTANCTIYGGLYQWNEVMQYISTPGAQGICPVGWHI
ncbi:MAG: hypothetical protein NTU44_15110, partial [Bacteroidetes bacterium]|nr:hypothetical protein [Bacteroidota bacterium]